MNVESFLTDTLKFGYRFFSTFIFILFKPGRFYIKIKAGNRFHFLNEHSFFALCVLVYAGVLFNLDVKLAVFFNNLIDPSLGEKILYVLPLGVFTYILVYGISLIIKLPLRLVELFRALSLYWWGASLIVSAVVIIILHFALKGISTETLDYSNLYYICMFPVSFYFLFMSFRSMGTTDKPRTLINKHFRLICFFAGSASVLSLFFVWFEEWAIESLTDSAPTSPLSIYNFGKRRENAEYEILYIDTVRNNNVTGRISYYLKNETSENIIVNSRTGTMISLKEKSLLRFQFQGVDPKFPLITIKPGDVLPLTATVDTLAISAIHAFENGLDYQLEIRYTSTSDLREQFKPYKITMNIARE